MMRRRPMRRMGAPLLRTAATTAVVVGTAGAVSHAQQSRYQGQAQAQAAEQQQAQDMADLQQQQAELAAQQQALAQQQAYAQQQATVQQQPAQPAAAPTSSPDDPDYQIAEIQKFAQLKDQGILTEEEFQAKKKQILGI